MEETLQKISETLSQPDWLSITVNIFVAIGTIGAAVVAAISAKAARDSAKASQRANEMQVKQMKLQNKLSLFEIRSKNYTVLSVLMERYSNISGMLAFKKDGTFNYDAISANSTELLMRSIGHELDEDLSYSPLFDVDGKILKVVQLQMETIENVITELSLLYKQDLVKDAESFLTDYKKLISTLYDYKMSVSILRHGASTKLSDSKVFDIYCDYESLKKSEIGLRKSYSKLLKNDILGKMKKEIKI